MKKELFVFCLLLPFGTFAQAPKSLQVIEPGIDTGMKVKSYEACPYIDADVYLLNDGYVVYENCERREILYPDLKSLRFPVHNERNLFALDKDGIYVRGEKIETDTTGFTIVGKNNDYQNPEILWKTTTAVYKNNKEIPVSDVATFQEVECFNGSYFKDKNFIYYFDKKIEGSDGATVAKSCDDFTLDKNNAYLNGEIITYNGEKVIPVNRIFYKISKQVLTRNGEHFTVHPEIDLASLQSLSASYSVDKNHAYYGTAVLPVKKEHLQNVKVWEQVNRAYLSDGQQVYSRDNDLKNDFDAKTFGMLPHSDFCFDKNGVYEREYVKAQKKVIYVKFPFTYTNPVSPENTFIMDNSSYIIYENQAYNPWDKKLYKNLTSGQITLAKEDQLRLGIAGNNVVKKEAEFEYQLYKGNNKIYWDDKETGANADSFKQIGSLYKDDKHTYLYSRGKGLIPIMGMDHNSLEEFNGFLKDKDFLYSNYSKVVRSKDLEILAVFTGYRPGCSQDRQPGSNYYLFRNVEGYWLAQISNMVTVRALGKQLPNQEEWAPNLRVPFEVR